MKQSLILYFFLTSFIGFSQKSGVAIMADNMNVMYYGVDNPITIGIPYNWKNTSVNITNGAISGTGSKRTVRPDAKPGHEVIIRVNSGNATSEFSFRIKRIPDPIFKIGSGKARMYTAEFKAQQYCRAELENFDFELRYNVISAKMIFHYFDSLHQESVKTGQIRNNKLLRKNDLENQYLNSSYTYYDSTGNRLDDLAVSELIKKYLKLIEENPELDLSEPFKLLKPGDFIEFTDIKIAGQDGIRTIDGKTVYLY